jgi:hypothetical protein
MTLTLRYAALLPLLLLAACAPAATTQSGDRKPTTARNPLTPGDVYLIKGTDQNGVAFESKLKLTTVPTQFNEARQHHYVDAETGYLVVDHGRIIQLWMELDGGLEAVCVAYVGQGTSLPFQGTVLRGTDSQITALLNRFSNTDSGYYGSSRCNVSKG